MMVIYRVIICLICMSFFLFFHQSTNAEEIPTYFKSFQLEPSSMKSLGSNYKAPSFIEQGVLLLDPKDKFQFKLKDNSITKYDVE